VTALLRPDGLPEPGNAFESAVVDLVVELFEAYPTWGTSTGYHRVDGRWPDLSEAGRRTRIAAFRRHAERLRAFDAAGLSLEEQVDRHILLAETERVIFGDEVLRAEAWDALELVYLMGGGLFDLLSREFAPWSERGASLLSRIEGLPALARAGLAGLTGIPGRPVALLQLDTALSQLAGVDELLDAAESEARRRAALGEASDLLAPMEAAAREARAALEVLRNGLDGDVRARASGEGRLGRELFAQKLRHTLGSDLEPEQLRERAWADYHAVRAEMVRLARETWPAWFPGEPAPQAAEGDGAAESALVKRVLDAIAERHQQPDGLIDYCHAEIGRIEAFCREHGIITLPEEPLEITWTPVFLRAAARAFLDSPGPLDRGLKSHFWITPPDESEGPEAVASYLREENDSALRILSIHEGIPGHYLQLAASNRCSSLARTVFTNGVFAEGWAVYVTQVMYDAGYASDDPGFALSHWKMYLRATANAILDVETHTRDMSEEEAMALMVDGAWQEQDEARGKWLRARISSTQLSTYFVGSLQMWDLELAARRRAAEAAGAAADEVPAQRIAGGLGTTRGFDQRAHMEAVISHGTPPIQWCRYLLGVDGVGDQHADGASGQHADATA
jgi:uncharacterized protein (DUF885 family)